METATTQLWKIDKTHSDVGFKVKHMMISTVSGAFGEYDAAIETDDEAFDNANIRFSAQVGSINTNNEARDTHLRSADFFDAEKYPEITFKSTSFNGESMTGDLTIKDITRSVTFKVDFNGIAVDNYGQTKAGFEISATINRKDFGLNWNAVTEAGNIVVSDKVRLMAAIQFIRQDA